MRQADGSDLLGANDARSASIGIIYVAPGDDRPSVLEAILMQDKLGRKQVAVVLPENSRAFQRPVDFDGLKNMRRGLKAEIIFVTSGVSGPAEFARQRRFTVYTSWDSYKSALRAELPDNGNAKKGPLLFNRNKPKLVPNANAPAPLESFDEPAPLPPQPLAAPIMPVSVPLPIAAVPLDDDNDVAWDEPTPMAPFLAASGAEIVDSSLVADDEWVRPSSPSPQDAGPFVAPVVPIPEDEDAKPVRPRSKTGPIPIPIAIAIPISLPQTGASTKPLVPGARGTNGPASPPVRSGNTGKQAAIGAGVVGAGAAAAFVATNRASVAGGAQPPIRGNVGGSGGGGGGGRSRRRSTRQLLAIALVILTLLLLAGIAFASPMGKGLIGNITGSTITATVTITPAHQIVSDSFVVTAVTRTPDPTAHQVQARILSYTSPSQSASANATGSIAGANATGTLIFANIGNGVQISGGILTGADGVQVSFGSFFLPFGSSTVQGTAVNQGTRGNISALDINGSCCGDSNVRVRNPGAFSGGRDPVPNSVITQNDINSASNNLISILKPSAQTALQQKVQANEQVVNGSLKCTSNVTPDHHVGDQAKSVTVTGTVTCTEEAYDQKSGLDIAANALKAEAAKNPGVGYALVGIVVTNVTSATVIDAKNTVSLVIAAQGEWVYQFTGTILNGIKNKLAKESQSAALKDVQNAPGVNSATISISSGITMPDAANITINVVKIPGLGGSPTPGSGSPTTTPGTPTLGTTPTGSPAITPTPTTGLGSGPSVTPTPAFTQTGS